jgi:hypothetical protein
MPDNPRVPLAHLNVATWRKPVESRTDAPRANKKCPACRPIHRPSAVLGPRFSAGSHPARIPPPQNFPVSSPRWVARLAVSQTRRGGARRGTVRVHVVVAGLEPVPARREPRHLRAAPCRPIHRPSSVLGPPLARVHTPRAHPTPQKSSGLLPSMGRQTRRGEEGQGGVTPCASVSASVW